MDSNFAYMERPDVTRRRRRINRIKAPFRAVGDALMTAYRRHLYGAHMRLIHRFGGHWFSSLHPIGGPAQKWCHWCGERRFSEAAD